MRVRSIAVIAACGSALVAASREEAARANGRFPAANQLVAAPNTADLLVLRTTYGVLVSRDRGVTWDWICEKAIGYGGSADPSLGVTASRAVIAGTFDGLSVSPDTGCAWSVVGGALDQRVIVDVVVRPDAPHAALALGSTYRSSNEAGASAYENQVFSSTDDGATWAPRGAPMDPTMIAETVEVAASDPHRVYVSGKIGAGSSLGGLFLVSLDDGATWATKPIALDAAQEDAPYIAAVDPTNPSRVYVRTSAANGGSTKGASRLLVTDDAGDHFRAVYTGSNMLGFAVSSDGGDLFLGGADGLFHARSSDLAFTKVSSIQVQCLRAVGAALYACSNESSGFILGASTDLGATFRPTLHLNGLRGPLACAPGSSTSACAPDWPALRDSLGGSADGGLADAAPDGASSDSGPAGPGARAASGGCGCSAAGAGAGAPLGVAVGVLALLARRRRSRQAG